MMQMLTAAKAAKKTVKTMKKDMEEIFGGDHKAPTNEGE